MFEDKTLKCVECGSEFVFSASEQEFYAEKGFTNEPKRCPHSARNAARKRKVRSSPPKTVLSTALTASTNADITAEATKNKDSRPVASAAGLFLHLLPEWGRHCGEKVLKIVSRFPNLLWYND